VEIVLDVGVLREQLSKAIDTAPVPAVVGM
jgi:hypothetical protein